MDLVALHDCLVLAIDTTVRSVTAWVSAIGTATGAKVMACVSSVYPVGHTPSIPAPLGSRSDGMPGKGSPTLRSGSWRVATTAFLRMSSTSIFKKEVGRWLRTLLRGHPCKMPLVAGHNSPRLPAKLRGRRSCRYMAARAHTVPRSMPSSQTTRKTMACTIMSKHLTKSKLKSAKYLALHPCELKEDNCDPHPVF